MYRTGRRSAAGIANWCRRDSVREAMQHSMQQPMHMGEEEYEPTYYPQNPATQSPQSSSGDVTPTTEMKPMSYYGDYASSDGYRSLMAFNSQQRTAGKMSRRDKPSEEAQPLGEYEDYPRGYGGPNMLQNRTSAQQVKSYPGASSLGYLLGGV